MTTPPTPEQHSRIAPKYKAIYRTLHEQAQAILAGAPPNDPVATFTRLREMLQAAWSVFTVPGSPARGTPEFEQCCAAYLEEPDAWNVRGVRTDGTRRGKIAAQSLLLIDAVKAYGPANFDAVLDLGCGWGHRLIDLWIHGGPRDAAYYGFERAEPALDIACLAAELFPDMNAAFYPFDFLRPDFNVIPGAPRTILVYTTHAIEQVHRLGDAMFDALLARFPAAAITGVHIEPIGFQAHADHPAWAATRQAAQIRKYNIDLYDRVSSHPRLKIVRFETGLFDEANYVPSALLVWRARSKGR